MRMINLYYATWTAPISRRRRVSVARSIRGDNGKTEKQSFPSIVHGEGNKKGVTRVSLGELREQVLINGGREGTTGEEAYIAWRKHKSRKRRKWRTVPSADSFRVSGVADIKSFLLRLAFSEPDRSLARLGSRPPIISSFQIPESWTGNTLPARNCIIVLYW